MKKSILVLASLLIALSLMSVGYVNWNKEEKASVRQKSELNVFAGQQLLTTMVQPFEFVYNVDSRFMNTVTKEDLVSAKSIHDILSLRATQNVASFKDVKVAVMKGEDEEVTAMGTDEVLNPTQLELLQSTDYSTDFYVYANYNRKNETTGELLPDHLVYYMTIIPENEAEYAEGNDAMIAYLKENSKEEITNVYEHEVKAGQIKFTVSKDGIISKTNLTATSGLPKLDETMEKLIRTLPGKWNPATNSKGEKVAQDLVFFFGRMGC